MDQTKELLDRQILIACLEKCNLDPNEVIDDIETGLIYFLRDTIRNLRKISKKNQTNEEFIKKKFCKAVDAETEQQTNNCSLVTIVDPLGDYRFAEKRELEMEKFYEDKIQNNREREDKRIEEENKTVQRYPYEQKKPKVYNEDQEIFKMLSKMKLEKNKDQITDDKIAEGQNMTIEMLIKGNDKQIKNNDFQNLRNEIQQSQIIKDQVHITHTNLIQYLENKLMYKKSRYLLQAYLLNQIINQQIYK